jgi:hypothetical protein
MYRITAGSKHRWESGISTNKETRLLKLKPKIMRKTLELGRWLRAFTVCDALKLNADSYISAILLLAPPLPFEMMTKLPSSLDSSDSFMP